MDGKRIALLVCAAAAAAMAVAPGAEAHTPGTCSIKQPKSLRSTARAVITFANNTAAPASIYWLDFTGRRVFYRELAAGERYPQPTWITHPWVVVQGGKCIGYTVAARRSAQFAVPAANQPPVVKPEEWSLEAGLAMTESLLENDSDPDGDKIKVKVREISFARGEWTGAEEDGTFTYVAGPGTSRALRKRIEYVAVDQHGLASKPAVAVIAIRPRRAVRRPHALAASAAAYWDGPWRAGTLCFGRGFDHSCYYMLSVAETIALDSQQRFGLTDSKAIELCSRFGIVPLKPAQCAKRILTFGAGRLWDRSVIHNAARASECLLFKVDLNRTLAHPRAGEWSRPQYHPLDSLVRPYNGDARLSGYGRWSRGLFKGRWRIPLVCERNRLVYRHINQSLIPAP